MVALLKFITLKLDNIPSGISVCVAGTALVTYGMLKDDNPIFIIGIVIAIGGYVLVRRKLKESIRNNP